MPCLFLSLTNTRRQIGVKAQSVNDASSCAILKGQYQASLPSGTFDSSGYGYIISVQADGGPDIGKTISAVIVGLCIECPTRVLGK